MDIFNLINNEKYIRLVSRCIKKDGLGTIDFIFKMFLGFFNYSNGNIVLI